MTAENRKLNETLAELLIGTTAAGVLLWGVIIWFVEKRSYFTIGIVMGVVLALLAACHMYWSLDRGMELGGGATKYLLSQNMVRYGVITIVFGVLCIVDIGNPIAAFVGIMCLKIGAYLQPFTHKIMIKLKRR